MRGLCRVCYRDAAVTRRGRVWHHLAYTWPPRTRCPGAGQPPFGQSGPDLSPLPHQLRARHPLTREHPGGTVYLLHFAEPFGHARHYLGWASDSNLERRLAHHAAGTGANLMLHVGKAGIGWELARTWPGDRARERRMKARGATRRCPVCRPELGPKLIRHAPLDFCR